MNRPQPPSLSEHRRERWKQAVRFAWLRGASARERGRLFHHVGLKPSLVFRHLSRYSPDRMLSFALRIEGGKTFQIAARDNGLDVGNFAEFFEPSRQMVPAELPPFHPSRVYDLGANIGAASLYFAAMYPQARFYGFEPMPANFEICAINYRNLPGSEVFPWAVGAKTETTTFDCLNDPRGGRLSTSIADPRLQLTQRINVQSFSIADLIEVQKLEPPEFLKIDVEGAEMEVLQGMEGHERSVKRIFVETHSPGLKADCLCWMQDRGFQIFSSEDPTAIWGDRA